MPYDREGLKRDADHYRKYVPGWQEAGLTDSDILDRALKLPDTEVPAAHKQLLRDRYGESALASGAKAFGRATMLDTLARGAEYTPAGWIANKVTKDLIPGLPDISDVYNSMESAPIQTAANTAARLAGGAGGMVALNMIPGVGQIATGGRLGATALRAALQAGSGMSQNIGEQADQLKLGTRNHYSPGAALWSGASSAGGQLIGGKFINPVQDKLWTAGKQGIQQAGAKAIAKGAGALALSPTIGVAQNALEEGTQAFGEQVIDTRNLTEEGIDQRAGIGERAILGGLFGIGGEIVGPQIPRVAKLLGRGGRTPPPAPGTPPPTTPPPPVATHPRQGPTPQPIQQGAAGVPPVNKFDLQAYVAGHTDPTLLNKVKDAALHHAEVSSKKVSDVITQRQLNNLEPDFSYEQRSDSPGQAPSMVRVYKIGDKEWGIRDSDREIVDVSKDQFGKRNSNVQRIVASKHTPGSTLPTAVSHDAEHASLPPGAQIPFDYNGQMMFPVSRRRQTAQERRHLVGLTKWPLVPGEVNYATEAELDPILHKAQIDKIKAEVDAFRASQGQLSGPLEHDLSKLTPIQIDRAIKEAALKATLRTTHDAVIPPRRTTP